MNDSTRRKWLRRKRRIVRRNRARRFKARARPMLAARNVHYDMADRTRAVGCGGIGAMHLLARRVGLIDAVDRDLHLLKVHLPYHESDHVLNIAYNIVCGGECLADLETLRNDERTWTPWARRGCRTRRPPATSAGGSTGPGPHADGHDQPRAAGRVEAAAG